MLRVPAARRSRTDARGPLSAWRPRGSVAARVQRPPHAPRGTDPSRDGARGAEHPRIDRLWTEVAGRDPQGLGWDRPPRPARSDRLDDEAEGLRSLAPRGLRRLLRR